MTQALAATGATVTPLHPGSALVQIEAQSAAHRRGVPRTVRRLSGVLLLLAIWSLAAVQQWLSPDLLPGPLTVIAALRELVVTGQLGDALRASLLRVVVGASIGMSAGVAAALFAGLLRLGEDLIDAPIQMVRTLPWAGLVPLLLIWLGIDEGSKVALVALASFFPIYLNLFAGIRNVDETLVEAARTMGLRPAAVIRHVVLPGALPNALVGLRYALGSSWLALVFAETVNSQTGIGYLTTYARETYRTDIIFVCLLIYAALGLSADIVVRTLEGRLLSWRPSFKAA
ncbi:ABC transporter permease [Sphingobium sufflavum]|uniref:ABC transporter permease n=1 Tax=Sphingobium sufflavum TaxID=1129547 RepID=UPI001F15EADF|nr:ABC transporter permease [Sphingobium sufflavum]MCE7796139.1 ABC transporter permease [Sphingobium sufflavum]